MNRLRELRMSKHLSQRQFALQFNVSQGAVSGWENGRYEMGVEDMKRFADFFGVSVDYLLGGTGVTVIELDGSAIDKALQQKQLIDEAYELLAKMPPEMQKAALAQIRALADLNK